MSWVSLFATLVTTLLLSVTATAQLSKIDQKNGYKTLKFDMTETEFSKIVKKAVPMTMPTGHMLYDVKDSNFLSVGECRITTVYVIFISSKLKRITLLTVDNKTTECLLEAVNELFGQGQRSQNSVGFWETKWDGSKVTGEFTEIGKTGGKLIMQTADYTAEYEKSTKGNSKNNALDF